MKKSLLVILFPFALLGCSGFFGIPTLETWEHVVAAANYSEADGMYVYRYEDDRFNQEDWYEIYMDDSFWTVGAGWSRFEPVFDADTATFYYQPCYYDGYVEWYATADGAIVGATLRFYRLTTN